MKHRVLVAAFCLLSSVVFAQRLPAGVQPTNYTLWFAPDLDKETFRGRASIALNVSAPTTTITLNAAEITFGEVMVDDAGGSQVAKVASNEKDETATFTVPRAIARGAATVHIP